MMNEAMMCGASLIDLFALAGITLEEVEDESSTDSDSDSADWIFYWLDK